jgi:hypothetical protein
MELACGPRALVGEDNSTATQSRHRGIFRLINSRVQAVTGRSAPACVPCRIPGKVSVDTIVQLLYSLTSGLIAIVPGARHIGLRKLSL